MASTVETQNELSEDKLFEQDFEPQYKRVFCIQCNRYTHRCVDCGDSRCECCCMTCWYKERLDGPVAQSG